MFGFWMKYISPPSYVERFKQPEKELVPMSPSIEPIMAYKSLNGTIYTTHLEARQADRTFRINEFLYGKGHQWNDGRLNVLKKIVDEFDKFKAIMEEYSDVISNS